MAEMEEYLDKECSDIDYTVVRPGGLTNLPSSGIIIINNELITKQFRSENQMLLGWGLLINYIRIKVVPLQLFYVAFLSPNY